MSVKNENEVKAVENVEVVNNVESTEMVARNGETKKFKLPEPAKKVLKGVGIGLGIIGSFLLGAKFGSRKNECDEYEEADYEVENSDEE